MAMSDTMSGPNDWLHFYQQNFPAGQPLPSSVSEATTVTTTVSATSPPLGTPAHQTQLSPEGRVSKPIRRRSRASRRTPTTLLNTDTTNFRAMVQQFTGGPSAPFAPTASSLPHLGFGLGARPSLHVNPNGLMLAPSHSSGFHIEQQQQQQQHIFQHQNPNQNQNPQHYMYSNTQGGDNMFVQRLSNPTPTNVNVTDQGLFMDRGHGGRFFPSTSSS